MKHLKKILLVALLVMLGGTKAASPMGGYITYRHLSADKYLVQYHFIRDCKGISLSQLSMGVYFGTISNPTAGGTFSLSPARTKIVKMRTTCDSLMPSQCTVPNTSGYEGRELHTYEDTIDFSKSPFSSDYNNGTSLLITFYAGSRGRPGGITTGPSSSEFYIKSELVSKINNVRIYNSSPKIDLTKVNITSAVVNIPYKSGPLTYDNKDYDSFAFELSPAISIPPNPAPVYISPFTYQYPVTPYCNPNTSITCTAIPNSKPPRGISFSANDGLLVYTPTNSTEVAVIVRKLKEYRRIGGNMTFIGSVLIEHQISAQGAAFNNFETPIFGGHYRIKFGDSMNWNIISKDPPHTPQQTKGDSTIFELISAPTGTKMVIDTPYVREMSVKLSYKPTIDQINKYQRINLLYYENNCNQFNSAQLTATFYIYSGNNTMNLRPFYDKNGNGLKDVGENFLKNIQFFYGSGDRQRMIYSNDTGLAKYIAGYSDQVNFKLGYSTEYKMTLAPKIPIYSYDDTTYTVLVPLSNKGGISGKLYYDIDNNCTYSGNSEDINNFSNIGLGLNYGVTNTNGNFTLFIDSSITSNITLEKIFDTTLCNTSNKLKSAFYKHDSTYNLGNIAVKGVEDVLLNMTCSPISSGNNFTLSLNTKNLDKTSLSNWYGKPLRIWLNIPKNTSYISANNALNYHSPSNSFYYDIANIQAYLNIENAIILNASSGLISGQILNIRAKTDSTFSDLNSSNNSFSLNAIVSDSSSNNKMLITGQSSIFRKNKVSYRINYQNTSRDTAYNVTIKNVLNNAFDIKTFKFKGSNFPAEVSIKGQEVTFTMAAHNLPSKIKNQSKSTGYVAFDIELKQSIDTPMVLNNSASIKFNELAPINTAPVKLTHTFYSQIINLDKLSYCQKEEINIQYIARALNTDGKMKLEYSLNNGVSYQSTGIEWTHDILNDTGQIAFKLPSNFIGSSTAKLRVVPRSFSTAFIAESSTFEIDNQTDYMTQLTSGLCKGEAMKIELKNANSYNLYLNNTLYKSNLSGGNQDIPYIDLKNNDSIKVIATKINGCVYSNTVKTKLFPVINVSAQLVKTNICQGEKIELDLTGSAKFTINADNVKVKENVIAGKYLIDNPSNTLSVNTIDSFACTTSITLSPATVETLPTPMLQIISPTPLCEKDSVQLTLTNTDTASYIVNNKYITRLNKNTPYLQYMTGTFNLNIYTEYKSAIGCIYKGTSEQINFGQVTTPILSRKGDTLFTSPYKKYQWYNINGTITSAKDTLREFAPPKNGLYYVKVTSTSNCEAISLVYNFFKTNTTNNKLVLQDIQLSPNPFGSQIKISNYSKVSSITIYTITGKLVRSSAVNNGIISTEDLKPGQYIFEIQTKAGTESVIMTKN